MRKSVGAGQLRYTRQPVLTVGASGGTALPDQTTEKIRNCDRSERAASSMALLLPKIGRTGVSVQLPNLNMRSNQTQLGGRRAGKEGCGTGDCGGCNE